MSSPAASADASAFEVDVTVETGTGGTWVRASTRPIAGEWSTRERNTQLAEPEQSWHFDQGHWHAVPNPPAGIR